MFPQKSRRKKITKQSLLTKPLLMLFLRNWRINPFPLKISPMVRCLTYIQGNFSASLLEKGLINNTHLSIAGDGTPVVTSARERKRRVCKCAEKGIMDCDCERYFSQPDCDVGWDSSRGCFYHGYDLYMMVASDSESDLPVFPLLHPASMHDSHGFIHAFFRMKKFLPDFHVEKLLLDSAHDAMPYYLYCKRNGIQAFIDHNEKRGIRENYKDDFTIGKDGFPVCKAGRKMNHDDVEISKRRVKFRCLLASRKYGCSCENPCSGSKYGRTVYLAIKDNPRFISIPPRDSDSWKTAYHARTSLYSMPEFHWHYHS